MQNRHLAVPYPIPPLIPHFLLRVLPPQLNLNIFPLSQQFSFGKTEENGIPAVHAKGGSLGEDGKLGVGVETAGEVASEAVYYYVLFWGTEGGFGVAVEGFLVGWLGQLLGGAGGVLGFGLEDWMLEFPHLLRLETSIIVTIVYRIVYLAHFRLYFPMHVLIRDRPNIRDRVFRDTDRIRGNISKDT